MDLLLGDNSTDGVRDCANLLPIQASNSTEIHAEMGPGTLECLKISITAEAVE